MTDRIVQITLLSYNELFKEWQQLGIEGTWEAWALDHYGVEYLGPATFNLASMTQRGLGRRFIIRNPKSATIFTLKYT